MLPALQLRERTGRLMVCEREDDFPRVLRVSGDIPSDLSTCTEWVRKYYLDPEVPDDHKRQFAGQEQIRCENPDLTHCRFLEKCPRACSEFQETLTDAAGKVTVEAGSPCPNNPLEQPNVKRMLEALEDKRGLLVEADRMGDLADLGILPRVDEITPEEFEAARIVRSFRRNQELKIMAGVGSGFGSGADKD